MTMSLIAEPVTPDRCPELEAGLRAAGLPTDDLGEPGRSFFRFRDAGRRTIGFIGFERTGPVALLRSLAVAESARGQGFGLTITRWALDHMAHLGITDVYLLTTGAAGFFAAKLGFVPTPRGQAPEAIRASRQFAALCPSSAVLMHRRLPS
jgi:N-acetylglutamate synthase-like GNAT family acetyltransferase